MTTICGRDRSRALVLLDGAPSAPRPRQQQRASRVTAMEAGTVHGARRRRYGVLRAWAEAARISLNAGISEGSATHR